MLCNYHFLRHLAPALHHKYSGKKITECYSQNKDELIIGIGEEASEFFLRANLGAKFTAISFHEDLHRARKNSITLFDHILGLQITDVTVVSNDRSFFMTLENNHFLLFKMHGNRSNIIAFKGNELTEMFHHHLTKDENVSLTTLAKHLAPTRENYLASPNPQLHFPTLGKEVKRYLDEKGFSLKSPSEQWLMLTDLLAYFDKGNFHIIVQEGKPELSMLPASDAFFSTKNPIEACNEYFKTYTRKYLFEEEKRIALKTLETKRKSLVQYIANVQEKLVLLQKKRSYSEIADIIMANLHLFNQAGNTTMMDDFYTGGKIQIEVPQGVSPQKFAENYYRKSKNQSKETEVLQRNITGKEAELANVIAASQTVVAIENGTQLRKYIAGSSLSASAVADLPQLPFHTHEYGGYTILVGKNAKANDDLLRNHTSKNDLWLHARATAGSHVIIKEQKNKPFPENVLEKAAQLAAFYSKAKHDSLCPVIYTPRKYVRKAKHLAPGQVLVEKEKVILVVPSA